MDSDVSAEGDFEPESPKYRSWVSSNSEGHESPTNSPAKNSDHGSSSSSSAKRASSSDRESSPEAKDSDASDKESSSDVKENAGSDRDSSPEHKPSRDSSPEHKSRDSSPERKSRDSSPERKPYDRDSSPEGKASRESSPDKNDSDRERSPSIKHSPPTGVTSPENGVWPSSPSEKPSPVNSTPASPHDYKDDKNHADRPYETINGDVSPKSAKRSNSVGWDSRSDIASSLDSVSPSQFERQESKEFNGKSVNEKEKRSETKKAIIDFADDLSDVSDIESNDSFEGDDRHDVKEKKPFVEDHVEINDKHMEDAVSLHVEGEEQLDFEAEEGECSPKLDKNKDKEEIKKEKEQSDLEEGELTDDNDTKPEETERPVCRFFSRGHCTWGSNCRFIHPGVMDKGNYSMFETVRPIITPGGPPPPNAAVPMMYPAFPPHMPHSHIPSERPGVVPPGGAAAARKEEATVESAWERGLRQAKEMIRKSSKRKETEVDFEDKKMNLTLSQDEIDKENDYYSRHSGSPVKSPDANDKWKLDSDKSHRGESYGNDLPPPVPHAGAEVPPIGYYPPIHHGMTRPDYWGAHRMGAIPYEEYGLRAPPMPYGPDYYSAAAAGRRYMHPNYYPPRPGNVAAASHHAEFYERKPKHKQYPSSSREVIVQKNDKPYKDDSPSRYRNRREDSPRIERARDDEWADPWMRTKSPASGRRGRRKNTYSSGSSFSSSSESSRSSSRSSFSSKSRHSRSRSKIHSSASHSSSRSASESQTRKKPPMQFKLSPSSRTQLPASKKVPKSISPTLLSERRAATERAMHMNPPPPSPKIKTRPHSPPAAAAPTVSPPRKSGLPDRLLAHSKAAVVAAMARSSESHSSKSSSGSSSSDSSSDSSDSSASSSSTSKSKTPPAKVRAQKRNVPEDLVNVSQPVKNKALDALKLSGQKQQIKLTLKGSGNASQKRAAANDNAEGRKGKKRLPESSDSGSESDLTSPKKGGKQNSKKGVPSRREELLQQLRAVEDAIARKRSKITSRPVPPS